MAWNSGVPAGRGEQEEEEVEGKWAGGRLGVIGDLGVQRGAQVEESSLGRDGRKGTEVTEREREENQTRSGIKKAVLSSDAAATNCDPVSPACLLSSKVYEGGRYTDQPAWLSSSVFQRMTSM